MANEMGDVARVRSSANRRDNGGAFAPGDTATGSVNARSGERRVETHGCPSVSVTMRDSTDPSDLTMLPTATQVPGDEQAIELRPFSTLPEVPVGSGVVARDHLPALSASI